MIRLQTITIDRSLYELIGVKALCLGVVAPALVGNVTKGECKFSGSK